MEQGLHLVKVRFIPTERNEPARNFLKRHSLLPEEDPEARRVGALLRETVSDAHSVSVWAIDHEPARRRFQLALELDKELKGTVEAERPSLGVQELWYSTGRTDPLTGAVTKVMGTTGITERSPPKKNP